MIKLNKTQVKIFILCWAAYASIYFGRVNLSVAIPQIQNTFGWSKGSIGLIGTLFYWVYGFGQLINGQIGDKVSARKIIFMGLITTAVCNIFFGFSYVYLIMIILWVVNAYAQSLLWGPIVKSITNWYEYDKRSSVSIGISTSMVAGYLLAWGGSGLIISRYSWNYVFLIPGVVIFIYSIIWFIFFIDKPKVQESCVLNDTRESSISENQDKYTLLQVVKRSKLIYIVIACCVQGIIKDSIALWAPSLFMETQSLDINKTIQYIIFIPCMNLLGMMLASYLNKKMQYKEKRTIVWLFIAGIITVLGYFMFGSYSTVTALLFLGLLSAVMYGANTLLLGVIPLHFSKYNRASSVAGFLDFCSYFAAGFSTFVTGVLVDSFGWNGVMVFWIVCLIIGTIALLMSLKYDKIAVKMKEVMNNTY
ncbi:MFS transporter [Vallitalea longa]|uniref:MFS transporter n=1 Tax=Vallitalea longa TaxID=2936439 RepID=A0A9W6DG20_9FIRM|nr:MFS transporter [Vallitalea longa]GKX31846.1 MFS transporter [Vallitalea longa]